MLAVLLACALVGHDDDQVSASKGMYLQNPEKRGTSRLMIEVPLARREPPKISPLHKWEFPFHTVGYGLMPTGPGNYALRLRVYYQRRKENDDPAPFVARAIMRLWDFNVQR